jgi:hypothetical protein
MSIIFEQRGGGTAGTTHWLVEHVTDPHVTVPGLIRFYKANRGHKRLDVIARWLPEGHWDLKRQPPRPPVVPKWLIERVEAHLLQEGL